MKGSAVWMQKRPAWKAAFELNFSAFTFTYRKAQNLKRKVEFQGLCPHSLCFGFFFFFVNAELIYKQWSWISQESRWEEPKNHWLCVHRSCIKNSFWEIWLFHWILMAQALCLAVFWTAPGACSLTPTVFCISIGFCTPFRFSLKHYINNYRVNTGVCNGAFKLKRLLDSCK